MVKSNVSCFLNFILLPFFSKKVTVVFRLSFFSLEGNSEKMIINFE